MMLPSLPPTPTAPMSAVARKELAEDMRSVRKHLSDPATTRWIRDAYARVWIHLALVREVSPAQAANPSSQWHKLLLPAFLAGAERIGVHNIPQLVFLAPEVSLQAAFLWRSATKAQAPAVRPLPGFEAIATSTRRKTR